MILDSGTHAGGWDFGWEIVFFVMMRLGAWVPALLVSIAVAALSRR